MAGSVDFDGVDDHVDHGSGASLDDLAALTASVWIYPRTLDANFRRIIIKRDAATGAKWEIFYSTALGATLELNYERTYATTAASAGTAGPPINTLTWICVTEAAGAAPKLFTGTLTTPAVEVSYGSQVTGVGALNSDAAGPLTVGRRQGTASTLFDGLIFRPTVLNTYLGATADHKWIERLRRLDALQAAATFGTTCVLAAEYANNGDLTDRSSFGNNGTATGSPANGAAFDAAGSPIVRLR